MKIFLGDRRSGIALVIVMISIFVLTMLAAGFAYSMKVETRLAQHANNETELQWLGRSGVEYARWILSAQASCQRGPGGGYDALNQVWAGGSGDPCSTNGPLADVQQELHLGKGSFTWKITDHERKANINNAGEGMLQQAMMIVGVDSGASTPIVSAIMDWIDRDDQTHIEGAEAEYYKRLDPPYETKNGPMDDISELLMIRGITEAPELYWGAASTNSPTGAWQRRTSGFGRAPPPLAMTGAGLVDLFTTLSSGRINVNTASADVLQLIPGVDQLAAEAIVAGRQGEDDGSGLLGPYRTLNDLQRIPNLRLDIVGRMQQFCDVKSRTFDVEVTASVGGSQRVFYATLVRNSPKDIAVVSFYWKM